MAKPNATVAHEWYHNYDECGSGKGSNFYYEGDTIYSYGSHYPLARKVDFDQMTVLFQRDNYSMTTGRHRSLTLQAIRSGADVFYVDNVRADTVAEHRRNHEGMLDVIKETAEPFARARTRKPGIADEVERLCESANRYLQHFELEGRVVYAEDFLPEGWWEAVREQRDRHDAAVSAGYEEDRARYERELLDWRAGKRATVSGSWHCPIACRVGTRDGEQVVQTTRGAEFHTRYAAMVWRIISRAKRDGEEWASNGAPVRLGVYKLDRVLSNGDIVAGCHNVSYEECRNVAVALGLTNPTEEAQCA
jgi:hypothetical protein